MEGQASAYPFHHVRSADLCDYAAEIVWGYVELFGIVGDGLFLLGVLDEGEKAVEQLLFSAARGEVVGVVARHDEGV